MPELTHDPAEDGFHEIQLSGKQLVFLFMATTVVSVVIFLCGVLVGRGVGSDPQEAQAIDSSAVDTPLSTPAETVPLADTEAPAPIAAPALSYDERLRGDVTEQLKTQPEPTPAKPAAPPSSAPATTEAGSARAAALNVPTSGRPGVWFLQVTALKNEEAAAESVRGLIDDGFPAYLDKTPAGTPPFFRVRIGRYATREEAEQVASRLQKEKQFTSDIRR